MEDVNFKSPLEFTIEIVAIDDGVSVFFENLDTSVEYDGVPHVIHIEKFERTFKSYVDPIDPDDIRPIEHNMIDLGPVLREEIIMATHTL
jgi:hypothetical protein